jgi:predicted MFS family arabinose efflux permease
MAKEKLFTPYQIFLIATLAFLQFAIILDFMVLSPLGAQMMPLLDITPSQFGLVVSAYALSAGASGLLAAGFADRFDRKKLLLFFFAGFIAGTFLCGFAPTYPLLLAARIITGIFGGVIGSISFAIITDLFPLQTRGRVMGFVQMAFAVSQVLGLPAGLYLSNLWDWHAPFLMIAGLCIPLLGLIMWKMEPVDAHLAIQKDHSAFQHLMGTVSKQRHLRAFAATTLLATGGFMLMPFGSAFAVNNLGIRLEDLPLIYLVTGICSMIAGPLIGKLTDRVGPMRVFAGGSALSILLVLIYTNLGVTPLWLLIAFNAILFAGITARMISSSALLTAVPAQVDRGAFMGVNASVSQISGGISSAIAGLIVHQTASGRLEHYPALGWVVASTMLICVWLMYNINREVRGAVKPVLTAPIPPATHPAQNAET